MQLSDIKSLMQADLTAIDDEIRHQLHSDVVLIDQVSHYIINSGGKRLRPMLVVVGARALGSTDRGPVKAAAIIEFIHTATLLHDDVVDDSDMRRGKKAARMLWGNQASVLVGDFLLGQAFRMMVTVGSMPALRILSNAAAVIAEGEVMQLAAAKDLTTTEDAHLEIINAKTAALFSAAAEVGPIIADAKRDERSALKSYGTNLGLAFQLVDDVLDYGGNAKDLGKNIGDDLAEGKPTLPLIHAMKHGSPEQAKLIENAITNGGLEHIDQVAEAIKSTGALEYTEKLAHAESEAALTLLLGLPDTPYRDALAALARLSVERNH